jgi:membrane-bound lytic murein transglycosylase B
MKITKKLVLALTVGLFLVPSVSAMADAAMDAQCAQLSASGCAAGTDSDACKTLLTQCSTYYDQQSAALGKDISATTQQKNTLANAISNLKKKISNLQVQINQGSIKVQGLNMQITDTQSSIVKTTQQISDSQKQIASALQAIAESDQEPLFEILLTGNLSDFFTNLANLESVNAQLSTLMQNNKDLQSYLTQQKGTMDTEVNTLQQTIALQQEQEQENSQNKAQQEQDLQLTEAQYQAQVAQQQTISANSAKIKALLFNVAGGDTTAPTFGQAITIATTAAQATGVAPAFLLAIISQESAIGKNVGQCEITDTTTGNGKKISSGAPIIRVMSPTRDIPPFLQITAAAGKDPMNTPVSCWITAYVGGQPTGWGGAMGPAQFIPSTWNLFTGQLQSLLGRAPDPWSVNDSFTAAGLYLSQLGASAQTAASESKAASRYYGGSSSYASSVMYRTNCIQSFITSGSFTYDSGCQARILGG